MNLEVQNVWPPRGGPSVRKVLMISFPQNLRQQIGAMLLGGIKAPRSLVVSATAQQRHELQALKQIQQEKQSQLKGLDVLRAMQRAAAEKNKVKVKSKRKGAAVKSSRKGEDDEDYSNVRPFMVKSEWRVRLNEFEKRLQHLTSTK